jgi:hypothetical protein
MIKNIYSLAVFAAVDRNKDLDFVFERVFIVLDILPSITIQTLFLYLPLNM